MKPEKRFFKHLFLLLLLIGAVGCKSNASLPAKPEAEEHKRPERIASLSPSATEILYGVGAFSRVVAVSDYCTYPPEAKNLPHIGGWQNVNLEQIASFRADLIVMTEAEAPLIKDRLDAMNIRTLVVPSRSVDDALAAILKIGQATGNEREARELVSKTRGQLDEVRAQTRELERRRVLCVVDRVPGTLRDLYTASDGSFLEQLIEIAGGESIAPPGQNGWGKITKEAVVALNPEIILDMVQGAEGRFAEDPQAVWQDLPQIDAVRNRRVYPLRDTSVLHPSHFIGDTARRFAEIIHPEVFRKSL